MSLNKGIKKTERCQYVRVCYLAESLKCFGYKTDCALYLRSNGESCSEERFHETMNRLIDKTKAKYEKMPE